MRDDIHRDLMKLLKRDFAFKSEKGAWLQRGRCPDCDRWEVFTRAETPWLLKCSREDRCGWSEHVTKLYPDIFDTWSERYPPTEANPTASADAYLSHNRGFDLLDLRAAYTQESYFDPERKLSTATVRFALPDGSWWERLIDLPGRFNMKARFKPGRTNDGDCWHLPARSIGDFADAEEIWFPEGIFDAIALEQGAGQIAATTLQSNVYPEAFLARLAELLAEKKIAKRPRLIFAFDVGAAGVLYTGKFVKRAREEGWEAGAAQVRPDGEGNKLDWNDLLNRKELDAARLEEFLYNGSLTIAASANEKAALMATRTGLTSFHLTFGRQTFWAKVEQARYQEHLKQQNVEGTPDADERAAAIAASLNITKIANRVFRTLYFQRDEAIDDHAYFLAVDGPHDRPTTKAGFPGAALAAGAEFKKRLLGVDAGGWWTGSTWQLEKILEPQSRRIRYVEAIQFTGYSRQHGAYVFGDIAVKDGRVHTLNDHDYFELGKLSIKLKSPNRMLELAYRPQDFNTAWLPDLWLAYRERGIVALAFWFGSFFAEQIRATHASLGFLEMWGEADTGKSTLIEFFWKMAGRRNHEGDDPAKATAAGLARTLASVGNLPVVFMEGDRDKDALHSRRFDWEELKPAYNGRLGRAIGKKNNGLDTESHPFRGALVIEQNDPVAASTAIQSRIMSMKFTTDGFTAKTKAAADRLEAWPMEELSGFVVHAARREADMMAIYRARFAVYHDELLALPTIRMRRIAKCHAQLLALLDALAAFVPLTGDSYEKTNAFIRRMHDERQLAIDADHPDVELFWERFDYLLEMEVEAIDGHAPTHPINHSRDAALIAVSLGEIETRCANHRLELPPHANLKKHLKTSRTRRFVATKTVNSRGAGRGAVHCWVFEKQGANRKDRS